MKNRWRNRYSVSPNLSMTNDSVKLAQLWIESNEMKDKIDNVLLPLNGHLKIDDPELISAMEQMTKMTDNYFEKFDLVTKTGKHG